MATLHVSDTYRRAFRHVPQTTKTYLLHIMNATTAAVPSDDGRVEGVGPEGEHRSPPPTGAHRYRQLDAHIGQGTYGKVEKAIDRVTGEVLAIKKVKVETSDELVASTSGEDPEQLCHSNRFLSSVGIHFTVLREIKVMRELDHPNIISIKDVYVEGDFINLVMPHMLSDLRKLLERRVRLSEAQIKCVMQQIIRGVAHLHAHWVLHRDLAPANIFIDSKGICKVADFGLSRTYGSPRPSKKTPKVVTLWYRAPELLYGAQYYQDRVDVWSLGCIFAELLMGGRPLFPGQTEIEQLGRIFELCGTPSATSTVWPDAVHLPAYFEFTHTEAKPFESVFVGASSIALDLLQKMLTLSPLKRPSAIEALEHPYFTSYPLPCQPSELPMHLLRS